MCKLFGKSRQAFYKSLSSFDKQKAKHRVVIDKVKQVRKRHRRMGCRKLLNTLSKDLAMDGIKMGRDKMFELLREENMLVQYRRRYVKTTQSKHQFYKFSNLISGKQITRAEELFVSDITYIKTKSYSMYLFLVTDAYSKKIMGWKLSDNMKVINAIEAAKMAIKNRIYPSRTLIHHSDRGLQYCNPSYTTLLEKNNIQISMTTKYDPYENAIAERVNGILKTEYDIADGFQNKYDAQREIKYAITLYNTERPHLSCNYMVPEMAHRTESHCLKRWSRNIINLNSKFHQINNTFTFELLT